MNIYTTNASRCSLFNLADGRIKYCRPERSLVEPAVVFPDLLHNFHYSLLIIIKF
ncbi:Uncharacterised protein [Klebsiella pneumoniae]|nr:Uncharacterised protein [Klebsiella pneumoniae]